MSFRTSDDASEELLQDRLRILVHRLGWSYVNLWTLDLGTRVLEWKRGHFEMENAKGGAREYAQLFYSTFKPCCFSPGVGAVGRANLEGKHIWLTGDAVGQHAGSAELLQFLQCAEIKTTMCIPWIDSVLEIGTFNVVTENVALTDRIQQVLANDLLSVSPPASPKPAAFEHASTRSWPAAAMYSGFQQDAAPSSFSLQQQQQQPAWLRSANKLSLSLSSDISELQPNANAVMVKEVLSFGRHEEEREIVLDQNANQSHGLMNDHQYRSLWSSREGEPRTYSVSPEFQHHNHANPRYSQDDRNSAASSLHSHFPGPRNLHQIRRTNSCGAQYEIQKFHNLDEAQELHQQWRRQQLRSPASELGSHSDAELEVSGHLPTGQTSPAAELNVPFHQGSSWRRGSTSPGYQLPNPWGSTLRPTTTVRSNVKLMNQVSKLAGPLLRQQSLTALELLRDVHMFQTDAADVFSGPSHDVKPPSPASHEQISRPNTWGRHPNSPVGVELAGGSRGQVLAGHGEAAENHMMAERRRRTKQKENFAALRQLVPIISKADKASTLIDTITYVQLLQSQAHKLESDKESIDHQCALVEAQCVDLRKRNQELMELVSEDEPPSSPIHLNLVPLKLKSMNSS